MSIEDLDPNAPTDLEPAGEGALHIRTIKQALQEAFPAVDGVILNQGATDTATDSNPPNAATFSALFDAVKALQGSQGTGTTPIGGIMMWAGSIDSIPDGWELCNGLNGTPNLQDRFVIPAGGKFTENTKSVGVYATDLTLTTEPGGAGTGEGTFTLGDHVIAEDNIPKHNHMTSHLDQADVNTGDLVSGKAIKSSWANSSGDGYNLRQATGTPNVGVTSDYGAASSVAPLTHEETTIEVTGVEHSHVYGVPYYALAYIMRTG